MSKIGKEGHQVGISRSLSAEERINRMRFFSEVPRLKEQGETLYYSPDLNRDEPLKEE